MSFFYNTVTGNSGYCFLPLFLGNILYALGLGGLFILDISETKKQGLCFVASFGEISSPTIPPHE